MDRIGVRKWHTITIALAFPFKPDTRFAQLNVKFDSCYMDSRIVSFLTQEGESMRVVKLLMLYDKRPQEKMAAPLQITAVCHLYDYKTVEASNMIDFKANMDTMDTFLIQMFLEVASYHVVGVNPVFSAFIMPPYGMFIFHLVAIVFSAFFSYLI